MTTTRSLAAAFALTSLLATGLTACGGSSSPTASSPNSPGATTSTSPGATSPSASGSTGSTPGSTSASPTVPAKAPIEKGLTKTYPSAAVPLISGKVVKSTAVAETASGKRVNGWTVQINRPGTAAAAMAAIRQAMSRKGFKAGATTHLGGHIEQIVFTGAKYDNRVIVGALKHGAAVVYNVVPH